MSTQPHVVVIMADQLRWDALGSHTPHINSIINDGFLFDRAYCASPLCVPARGSFFTGLYPNQTGSIINPWEPSDASHGDVRPGIPNLYELMDDRWESIHVGKQHLYTAERFDKKQESKTRWITIKEDYSSHLKAVGHRHPGGSAYRGIVPEMAGGKITRMKKYSIPTTGCYEHGFNSFFDGFIANRCVEALRNRHAEMPVLLNAMFVAPHPPYEIPEPWYSMFDSAFVPENVGVWYPDQSPLQLYNLPGVNGARYTRQDWEGIWPVYLGLVALLDHAVGLIIDELKRQDMYDESLILFTTDHGEMLGSHSLYQKMCLYEEAVRSPVVLKLPGDRQIGGSSSQVVSAIDVVPTICEIVGLAAPDKLVGTSLVPAMNGETVGRDYVYIQFDGNGARGNFQRAVLDSRYKLIVDLFKDETYLELYDVLSDRQETKNLAFDRQYSDITVDLLGALRNHMKVTGDLIALPRPENVLRTFLSDYGPFHRA